MAANEVTLHWSKPICKQPGNYVAWPTIARTTDGELFVVFSGDRDEHVCPYGKTQLIRSNDDGETWSSAETINSTPLDDRDSGIIELRSGALVMSWFTMATWEHLDGYRAAAGGRTTRSTPGTATVASCPRRPGNSGSGTGPAGRPTADARGSRRSTA